MLEYKKWIKEIKDLNNPNPEIRKTINLKMLKQQDFINTISIALYDEEKEKLCIPRSESCWEIGLKKNIYDLIELYSLYQKTKLNNEFITVLRPKSHLIIIDKEIFIRELMNTTLNQVNLDGIKPNISDTEKVLYFTCRYPNNHSNSKFVEMLMRNVKDKKAISRYQNDQNCEFRITIKGLYSLLNKSPYEKDEVM